MAKVTNVIEYLPKLKDSISANCSQNSCSHTGSNSSACYGVKLTKKSK